MIMKKQYVDDDGRVIASMDVEYIRPRRTPKRACVDKVQPQTLATRREALHIALNATLAALFIAFVIMVVIGTMILIMTLVW